MRIRLYFNSQYYSLRIPASLTESAHSCPDSALLCLGYWSKLDLIELDDLKAAASLPDATKDHEILSDDDWAIVA